MNIEKACNKRGNCSQPAEAIEIVLIFKILLFIVQIFF